MIRKINSNLGIKLFIFLTVVIVLAVVPLSYTALQAIQDYGNTASQAAEEQIRFQAISYLKKITEEKARRYQEFFNRIEYAAASLGRQAETIYADPLYYAETPLYTPRYSLSPVNGIWFSELDDPVLSGYWGGTAIDRPVLQELYGLTHMKPMLLAVIENNPEFLAAHTIIMSGIGQYATAIEANKNGVLRMPQTSLFDMRDSEPVAIFTRKSRKVREVRWTEIYTSDVTGGVILTAAAPIYDSNDDFKGIAGVDISLDTMVADTLAYNKGQKNNIVEFSFLLDDKSNIIALPMKFQTMLGIPADHAHPPGKTRRHNISLLRSHRQDVVNLANTFNHSDSTFAELEIADENYYFVTATMAARGWTFGVAVKEGDLLFSVEGSRQALDETVKKLIKKGVFLTLTTILIALGFIYILIRFLITPLRQLADATRRVASGDLTVRSPVTTADEAGVLSHSFNSMVEQLEMIQEEQERYAESLKLEVIRQNLELVSKKNELENTILLLNKEVERRQLVSEALRNSQQQYYDTLESSAAGVYIVEDGIITYVNTFFAATLFQQERDELIGLSPLVLVAPHDRQKVEKNMQRRLLGEDIPPYTIQCLRNNGSSFYAEVWAKVSIWRDKKVMVGTVSDISSIKRNEEKLQIQDQKLQKSLEEKDILLKEIYHRTKNNMLVIISMLDLQAQDIDDENLRLVFQETENRIRTMALVHEKLYQSQNLSEIDMGSYLLEVARSLIDSMVMDKGITINSDIQPIPINIDYAVPLGLVVNEIVTNSVKHGFAKGEKGIITLTIAKGGNNTILLTIGDNGKGLPEDIDIENTGSFGLGIIISTLVKMQLKGNLEVDRQAGTLYRINFPEPKAAKRI